LLDFRICGQKAWSKKFDRAERQRVTRVRRNQVSLHWRPVNIAPIRPRIFTVGRANKKEKGRGGGREKKSTKSKRKGGKGIQPVMYLRWGGSAIKQGVPKGHKFQREEKWDGKNLMMGGREGFHGRI